MSDDSALWPHKSYARYLIADLCLQSVDNDLVVGGPGLAYWLQTNPTEFPDDQRVSGTYFAEQVSNSSLPLNFFSFHAVAACTDAASCDIADVSPRRGPSHRVSSLRICNASFLIVFRVYPEAHNCQLPMASAE